MSDPTNPPPSDPYGGQPPSEPYRQPEQPPAAANPYGQAPAANPYGQAPAANPYGQAPPTYGAPAYGNGNPDKRPGTVTAASIITIVFSAIGVALFAIFAAVLQGSDDAFDEFSKEIENQPGMEDYSASELLNVFTGFLVVLAIWSLIALVLAILAMRRHNWARILTVISAVMTALLSLLMILSGVSAIPLLAAIAAVVLYFTGGANEWYSRKNSYASQLPPGTQQPWG